jgi:hypothetical protein|nr:MAG TPA: hypothetical protein [Caudoviricetes sp.]
MGVKLTPKMIREIERIVNSGNTAEVVRLKYELIVFERVSEKRISAPVEVRE